MHHEWEIYNMEIVYLSQNSITKIYPIILEEKNNPIIVASWKKE